MPVQAPPPTLQTIFLLPQQTKIVSCHRLPLICQKASKPSKTTPVKAGGRQPDLQVPSPFKTALFCPMPKTHVKKGRGKEKISVFTSSEVSEIHSG